MDDLRMLSLIRFNKAMEKFTTLEELKTHECQRNLSEKGISGIFMDYGAFHVDR